MSDVATLSPVIEQKKEDVPGKIRPRQGSGSKMYANFRSAVTSLWLYRRYGFQAIAGIVSATTVVMATYILLSNTNILFHVPLNAQVMILLVSLGGILFVAGGLIMLHILLVLGRKRSSEFAMRLVVGARRCDMRNQLFFEALLLNVAGGIAGSACGLYIGLVLTLLFQFPFSVAPLPLLILIGASIVPGSICGLYAVRKVLNQDFARTIAG